MSLQKSQKAAPKKTSWRPILTWVFIAGITASIWGISQAMNNARLHEKDLRIRQLENQIQELQKDKELSTQPSFGQYEWQWAGDNLIGTVNIKRNALGKDIALVDIRKFIRNLNIQKQADGTYTEIDEGFKSQEALVSSGEGTVSGNKSAFKLTLPVKRNIFDSQGKKVGEVQQILEADLASVEAYAGKVTYTNPDKSVRRGDMILVRYNSVIRP